MYLLGERDEFASFEKEKLRDRRFPLPAFAFSPHSQPSQRLSGNLTGRVLAENSRKCSISFKTAAFQPARDEVFVPFELNFKA